MSLPMSEISTNSKTLEPGKWRIQIQAGREVVKVRLKGLRSRWFDLTLADKADFHSRLMKRANGEVSEAAVLRGTPAIYIHDGPWLMLWPSPAHNWTVEYQTRAKVRNEQRV
jgi:hypothetical protein